MKNLVLLTHRIGNFSAAGHTSSPHPSAFTWQPRRTAIQAVALNSPAHTLYFVTADNTLFAYHVDTDAVLFTLPLSSPPTTAAPAAAAADFDDIPAIPDEDEDGTAAFLSQSDSVLSLTYLPEHESLHIASSAGVLLSLHVHSLLMTEVGRVSPAIAAAAFSPDHELLAVVSTSYRLLLLTPDGDVLSDQPLTESGEGVIPGQVMAVRGESDEAEARCGVSVTWRGDGQYVAVSTYHSAYHYRRLRVFSRLGEPTSHSYPFPSQPRAEAVGLSPLLHWRPSGNLITSTERRQIGHTIKHEVVHFERNGLRHGELLLRQVEVGVRQEEKKEEKVKARAGVVRRTRKAAGDEDEGDGEEEAADDGMDESEKWAGISSTTDVTVLALQWNADSDLLALLVQHPSGRQSVQLYSVSNYKYDLQQDITLPSPPSHTASDTATAAHHSLSMLWDAEDGMSLTVLSGSGGVHSFVFGWDVHVALTEARWTAVVDGCDVRLTPVARAIIPPPMCHTAVSFPAPVSALSFACRVEHSEQGEWTSVSVSGAERTTPMCVVTSDAVLHVVHDVDTLTRRLSFPLSSLPHLSLPLSSLPFPLTRLRHVQLLYSATHYTLLATHPLPTSSSSSTLDCVIELTITRAGQLVDLYQTPAPTNTQILRLSYNPFHTTLFIQLTTAQLLRYTPTHSRHTAPSLSAAGAFPAPCPHFGCVSMGGESVMVGRDGRSHLYCDSTLLTPVCSSFSLHHPHFLCFTISGQQNALFFVSLHLPLATNLSPDTRSDPHSLRLIEKGSQLLTLVPSLLSPRAILTLPRGNLEAVYPRALTLDALTDALAVGEWGRAYRTCRVNRVDFNLLYDIDREEWVEEGAERLVLDVAGVDELNLFITSVVERDVREEEFPMLKARKSERREMREREFEERSRREQQASGGERRGAEGGTRAAAEMEKVRHGLTNTGREKRGERLHLDRRAREQAAAAIEAQLSASPTTTSFSNPSTGELIASTTKVNLICTHLRTIFQRINPHHYLLCILTTYVKQSPPDLESALQLVKGLHTTSINGGGLQSLADRGGRDKFAGAAGALAYVIFLCDVQQLYEVAVGMYDQQLALLVAQQAQMDPKEYVPFLRELFDERRGECMRRVGLDRWLKRWGKVVRGLMSAVEVGEVAGVEVWDEVVQLVKQQALWDDVLAIVTPKQGSGEKETTGAGQRGRGGRLEERERWGAISYDVNTPIGRYHRLLSAYASYLLAQQLPAQAAAAYLLCGDYDNALHAYQLSLDWRLALSLAHSLNFSQTACRELAHSFVAALRQQQGRASEAAQLILDYEEDVEEAIALLLQAEEWEEAVRICWTKARGDLIDEVVKPDLTKAITRLTRSLDRRRDKYVEAVKRLRVVRRAKLLFSAERNDAAVGGVELAGHEEVDDDLQSIVSGSNNGDMLSSASSVSGISAFTGLTSASTSSSSSLFSLPSSTSSTPLTADQKRIQRHQQRLSRKAAKRRIKPGSHGEDTALITLIQQARLSSRTVTHVGRTVRLLLQWGWVGEARQLQQQVEAGLSVQSVEEGRDMPLLDGMSDEQRDKLRRYWDWPGCVQRDEKKERTEDEGSIKVLTVGQHNAVDGVEGKEEISKLGGDGVKELSERKENGENSGSGGQNMASDVDQDDDDAVLSLINF